ncbi:disintegrin and metallo ase domain-containing 12-like, partial [Paramuricea clavata]
MLVILILFLVSTSLQQEDVKQIPDIVYDELNIKDKELLNKLKKYEIVHPEDVTPTANEFPDFYSQDENVERSISFQHNGKNVVLDLVRNRNLISPRYKERYYLPDGETVLRKRVAHIIYSPNDIMGKKFQCPHDGVQTNKSSNDFLNLFPLNKHHRSRRDVLTETKYVELILVNDNSQFRHYSSDIAQTKLRAISIANVVDSIYKVHNIRIALVMIETWTSGDQISVVTDSDATLTSFTAYKNNVLDANDETKDHDNAQFLSQTDYDQNVAGLANLKTICDPDSSTGIDSDANSNAAFTGSVMAHEMGHNFGLEHDDSCTQCPASNGCVMNAVLSLTPPEEFSQCSINDLNDLLLENVGHCLFNQPTKLATDAACGNGFVEDGEECDCGAQEDCERVNDTCCNYTSCMLNDEAQCADGVCCSNCQFISRGTVCREAVNSCDVPEFCNGTSEVCSDDLIVVNGLPCTEGYCYEGECRTHDHQCTEFWSG